MNVLIACEESQAVCIEFRKRGHIAFSCDIQDCSGGYPEWHIKDDVLNHVNKGWDLVIAHPPCTFLSGVGLHWNKKNKKREKKTLKAFEFVMKIWNINCSKICIENPTGYLNTHFRKPDQIIHPYYFGDNELKRTCLWIRGLPKLIHIKEDDLFFKKTAVEKPKPKAYLKKGKKIGKAIYFTDYQTGKDKSKKRSKTFPGIARAMAEQWG